jgi:hypothetical protein
MGMMNAEGAPQGPFALEIGAVPYLNACRPVMSAPVISRWMSCVPS